MCYDPPDTATSPSATILLANSPCNIHFTHPTTRSLVLSCLKVTLPSFRANDLSVKLYLRVLPFVTLKTLYPESASSEMPCVIDVHLDPTKSNMIRTLEFDAVSSHIFLLILLINAKEILWQSPVRIGPPSALSVYVI